MDVGRLNAILQDLAVTAAGDLESQTLEFKSWCKDERELSQQIAEAAVCLANAEGGFVIIGVDDRRVDEPHSRLAHTLQSQSIGSRRKSGILPSPL
jgi:predicted HTH transcriptional regulator